MPLRKQKSVLQLHSQKKERGLTADFTNEGTKEVDINPRYGPMQTAEAALLHVNRRAQIQEADQTPKHIEGPALRGLAAAPWLEDCGADGHERLSEIRSRTGRHLPPILSPTRRLYDHDSSADQRLQLQTDTCSLLPDPFHPLIEGLSFIRAATRNSDISKHTTSRKTDWRFRKFLPSCFLSTSATSSKDSANPTLATLPSDFYQSFISPRPRLDTSTDSMLFFWITFSHNHHFVWGSPRIVRGLQSHVLAPDCSVSWFILPAYPNC